MLTNIWTKTTVNSLINSIPRKIKSFVKYSDSIRSDLRNYSGTLIGLPIAILYFLARKITAEGAEERYKHLTIYFPSAHSAVIFRVLTTPRLSGEFHDT